MFRVGYYQFRPLFGKIQRNLDSVLQALETVTADLIVLPELCFTGYYFRDREEVAQLAEDPHQSKTVEKLTQFCQQRDMYLVSGFAEKAGPKIFNSSLLLGPDGIVDIYRKIHLFNEEKIWFDPGDTPFKVNTVRGVKVGMMICFDWIFPEATRSLAVLGAEVICHPSNLVLSYCQTAMETRCLENNVFAITCNRFGADKRPHGELTFTGKSQIVAPKGKVLHRAPSKRTALYVTNIDIALARDKMITRHNHALEDRRPAYYAPLCA